MSIEKMLEQKIKELVPLTEFCQFSVKSLDHEHCRIKIPLIHETKNHVNSMYFGALAAGADLAAGILAIAMIEQLQKNIVLVFKDFQANFLKRAEADVIFECTDGGVINDLVARAAKTGEREENTVSVNAYSDNDEKLLVATFKLTISLKQKA